MTETDIIRMRDRMLHRGPDGGGLWTSPDGRVTLAHRRLAIIDPVPAAAQPMSSPDKTSCITFNGEIYNHKALRGTLKDAGVSAWKTDHSDTEVLLRGLDLKGDAWLGALRGMFAFGYWNGNDGSLFLARDRLGIKPLYYAVYEGRLAFASEIKAILEDRAFARAVDDESLFHYLSFLTTPAPRTLFKGVRKVPAGGFLRVWPDGRIEEGQYWDPWDSIEPRPHEAPGDAAKRVLSALRDSVAVHAESDVPVGVFLSGGIDSSTNAALFSQLEGEVRTFTVGYEGDYASYQNEFGFARLVAHQIHSDHHELHIKLQDLLAFLPKMVYLQDEPIADPVCLPVYYVSQLARSNGVIVCQVGEGADELFWGYASWKKKLQAQRMVRWLGPSLVPRLAAAMLRIVGKGDTNIGEALRRAGQDEPIFWGGAEAFTNEGKQKILGPRLRKQFAGRTSWEVLKPLWDSFQKKAWDKSILHWMTYVDLRLRLPELLLMRVDKMGMGVSLEGRVPFLDHLFVATALSIPASTKTRGGISKIVLKDAVRGLIPDEVIDRPKQGFGVPITEWFLGQLGSQAREELLAFSAETGLLDTQEIIRLFEGRQHTQLWYLYNFVLWHRMFIDETIPYPEDIRVPGHA